MHVCLRATETCARVSSLRKLLQVQDKGVVHSVEPFLSFLQVNRGSRMEEEEQQTSKQGRRAQLAFRDKGQGPCYEVRGVL